MARGGKLEKSFRSGKKISIPVILFQPELTCEKGAADSAEKSREGNQKKGAGKSNKKGDQRDKMRRDARPIDPNFPQEGGASEDWGSKKGPRLGSGLTYNLKYEIEE